jgi:4-hydroxy-3-methylbut-2-enyl diphosphate reductase
MTTNTLQHKVKLTVLRAKHMGMCFGVRDAIHMAKRVGRARPLTILGQLVHNPKVLEDLKVQGVQFEDKPEAVETKVAMISAHGASERARIRARSEGLQLRDATCPLVHFAHKQIKELVKIGYHPVVIGRHGHVEVRGLTEDLAQVDVVLSEKDIDLLEFQPRFGVVAQTTQPIARVRELVEYLQVRFPESKVQFVDTVCQPTKQRQSAAEELARKSDMVLVVGGANSNNTRELCRTCAKYCDRVHHVQGPGDIRIEWLMEVNTLGITAGTSTPDAQIDAVENRVHSILDY